jgi:DNA-binding SARP family transcriptional activator
VKAQLGSTSIAFAPNKRFQLLCYLAYHGDWLSRDKLAFLFWPDTDEQTARKNLRLIAMPVAPAQSCGLRSLARAR